MSRLGRSIAVAVALVLVSAVTGAGAQRLPASTVPTAAPAAAPAPVSIIGLPAGAPRSGAGLERETLRVAGLLRCPVCQGLSVADSPSLMATNMKQQVRELVAAGYAEEQVLRYFETSYGEFVRLSPPLRGSNWVLWAAPLFLLAAAGALIARHVRRRSRAIAAPAAAGAAAGAELEPYLKRVRAATAASTRSASGGGSGSGAR